MHDAKLTSLSKITQGQKILVVEPEGTTTFEFGRPKDTKAVFRSVTKITHKPDDWTGKVYTVQITGGRRNEGRYGTTHVYVPQPEEREFAPVVELDLAVTGKRRVLVDPDGTMHVEGWTGGDVTENTPKGRLVNIAADGKLTILEDFPEEEEVPAPRPAVTDDEIATADRCHGCKGYGVVRKQGAKAGKPYRTLAGAEESTVKGNSDTCPVCKGATLLLRASA